VLSPNVQGPSRRRTRSPDNQGRRTATSQASPHDFTLRRVYPLVALRGNHKACRATKPQQGNGQNGFHGATSLRLEACPKTSAPRRAAAAPMPPPRLARFARKWGARVRSGVSWALNPLGTQHPGTSPGRAGRDAQHRDRRALVGALRGFRTPTPWETAAERPPLWSRAPPSHSESRVGRRAAGSSRPTRLPHPKRGLLRQSGQISQ
jgi:hypothetical protein